MHTPVRKLSKLALSVLSATLLFSFTGAPSQAQVPGPQNRNTRATVTITAAATVVSAAHYQASLALTCNGAQLCRAEFPIIGNRRRLTLTRMSCVLRSAEYAEYASGQIEVIAPDSTHSMAQFLPANYSSKWGYHVMNNAIDVQVASKHRFSVALFVAPGSGVAYSATCVAQGTLEVLQ